jgi:predicted AAA+ superfamily ATPase
VPPPASKLGIFNLTENAYIYWFSVLLIMERFNPWWFKDEDVVYAEWKSSKLKWRPRETDLLSLKPFSLNFVVGPRRVGKTTLIKIVVHELLERVDPKSVFYYSCDELTDHVELGEVLDAYLDSKSAWGLANSYIFLDEITFVREWWRAVKLRIDDGSLRKDVVTITGSASIELVKAKESFPGRRGHGVDLTLLPLSFSSYLEALSNIKPMRAKRPQDVWGALSANRVYASTIGKLFEQYLVSGGFPQAVRDCAERGAVSEETKKALVDWLRVDWAKAGRSDAYMKEVIAFLLKAGCTPISWLGIAKNTSIGSPNTAQAYVDTLQSLLVARSLPLIDPSGTVVHRKNRKIHFTDPLMYRAFSEYTRTPYDEACVVEAVTATHLARVFPVYYWRNSSEVDIVALVDGTQFGYEVKWGYHQSVKPKHIKHYVVLDKHTTPVFLASLDV